MTVVEPRPRSARLAAPAPSAPVRERRRARGTDPDGVPTFLAIRPPSGLFPGPGADR